MGLDKKEIQERYKWLTAGNEDCIVLEKKDYEVFMHENMALFIVKERVCDTQNIINAHKETLQNARKIIISFVTSKEYSFLNISLFVESISESVPKSCEVIFASHPNEAMSKDECSVTLLIKHKEGV